jgi:pSer/pThr/pTyr-binding forkhead associated (FHA) protein
LAFRVEITVDDHASYSVGSARADDNGVLTAHGALARFADQFCVGDPAPPQSISGNHVVAISVKSDGSGAGAAGRGGPLTDPTRALPCGGNGDNVFEYWLTTGDPIQLGDSAAAAAAH